MVVALPISKLAVVPEVLISIDLFDLLNGIGNPEGNASLLFAVVFATVQLP